MLKLCRVTKVKVVFLVLVYVFNFDLFEFSATILEKGLLMLHKSIRTNTYLGYLSATMIKFSIPAFF